MQHAHDRARNVLTLRLAQSHTPDRAQLHNRGRSHHCARTRNRTQLNNRARNTRATIIANYTNARDAITYDTLRRHGKHGAGLRVDGGGGLDAATGTCAGGSCDGLVLAIPAATEQVFCAGTSELGTSGHGAERDTGEDHVNAEYVHLPQTPDHSTVRAHCA